MTEFNDRRLEIKQHTATIEARPSGGYRGVCNDCGWDATTYDAFSSPARNESVIRRTMQSHRRAAMKADAKKAAKALGKP